MSLLLCNRNYSIAVIVFCRDLKSTNPTLSTIWEAKDIFPVFIDNQLIVIAQNMKTLSACLYVVTLNFSIKTTVLLFLLDF
jgi:hypothetical protein